MYNGYINIYIASSNKDNPLSKLSYSSTIPSKSKEKEEEIDKRREYISIMSTYIFFYFFIYLYINKPAEASSNKDSPLSKLSYSSLEIKGFKSTRAFKVEGERRGKRGV